MLATARVEPERTPRMLPLIYTTPAYTIAFVSVVVLSRIPETILLARRSQRRSEHDPTARQADRGSLMVMSIVTGGGVIVALVLAAVWTGAAIAWLRGPSSPSGGTSPPTWRCAPRRRSSSPGRIASCGIPPTRLF